MLFPRSPISSAILLSLGITSSAWSFTSLHQMPLTYVRSSTIDANGELFIVNTDPLIGFRDQYAPMGIPGCVMGYPEYQGLCTSVTGGLSFSLPGQTTLREFKVYIPAGTKSLSLKGNLPQTTKYAVAVKLGGPPTMTSLSDSSYDLYRTAANAANAPAQLLAGQEAVLAHNFGGEISLVGDWRLSSALTEGKWAYVRVVNGQPAVEMLSAIYEINRTTYLSAYNVMTWGSNGDPAEAAISSGGTTTGGTTGSSSSGSSSSGTTTGTGTTTTGTSLTGIALSVNQITVGATSTTVKVTPLPSTVTLPTCTSSSAMLIEKRGKPRPSGRGRIARTAQPSYRCIESQYATPPSLQI
jgi:hypothetical protein